MRTFNTEYTAYNYSELSDAAKEKVREDNNRNAWEMDGIRDNLRECAKQMFADIGLEMTNLEYDLNSQGGEPRFSVSGTIGEDFHVETKITRWGMDIDWYVGEDECADDANPEAGETFIQALLDSMSAAIFKMVEAEDEYVSSDEYAHELAAANDYEYDEEGNLF